MDISYNQHAERSRRKNRSSGNLKHLSLAPLTVKLPIHDDDGYPDTHAQTATLPLTPSSYLQGKSAPTTPRLLSRSPAGPRSRSHNRTPSAPVGPFPQSKSTTHIAGHADTRRSRSGATTPRRRRRDELSVLKDHVDSDWLFRAGAVMTFEARESKGQSWLVSRESSTSLAGMRDQDEEAFEEELARERQITASRRGSAVALDEEASPRGSRLATRSNSVASAIRGRLTPGDRPDLNDDSYFPTQRPIPGADFINLDEKLEELQRDGNMSQDDEAAIRRLMRRGQNGKGSWVSNMIGWSLFSVDENEEDSDDGDDEESLEEGHVLSGRSSWAARHFEGVSNLPEERMPPPSKEEGGWGDAAWLLSVASKVMF